MDDQAQNLRELVKRIKLSEGASAPARSSSVSRVLAVTSGKGGVGKSNVSVNLALALAQKGKRVLIFDADLGLANVDVLLGLIPRYSLAHVLTGERELRDIITEGPEGIQIIASGSGGAVELAQLKEAQRERFIEGLAQLEALADVIIVDTGAGITRNTTAFVLAADEVILVTTPEPTAIMDAYGMIKAVYLEKKNPTIRLVVNMVSTVREARETASKLVILARRFLNLEIENMGYIVRDPNMLRAVRAQSPLMLSHPDSPAAVCVRNLAGKLAHGEDAEGEGNLKNFLSKVVHLFK